jgi:hypothetical protein
LIEPESSETLPESDLVVLENVVAGHFVNLPLFQTVTELFLTVVESAN